MAFHLSLSDNKSPQVSWTLLIILADLNNPCSLISKSSNPLVTLPSASITFGITTTLMFYSFCSCLASSRYVSLFSLSFNLILWSAGTAKSTIRHVFICFTFIFGVIVVDYRYVWSSGRD